jgi:hypothetical protein
MAVPEAALVVLDFAVTKLAPNDPDNLGKVKRDVNAVCAAFKLLVFEYSATASARTIFATAVVGRNSMSWVATSPDAVDPLHTFP